MPGLVTQRGSMFIEEVVDVMFELTDPASCLAVLVDGVEEPAEPVPGPRRSMPQWQH